MPRKQRHQSAANISQELHDRIVTLAELVWRGNQSQMGRDLGINQSAISKVLAGKQQPSAKLLEKLATWSGINQGWLFTGQGEPLLEAGVHASMGHFLPLLDELLPGPPDQYKERLPGISYPVASAHYSASAYWYRVPQSSPVTTSSIFGVLSGDLLLLETDTAWTRKAAVLGKLVAFQLGNRRRGNVLLAAIQEFDSYTLHDRFEAYRLEFFGMMEEEAWLVFEREEAPMAGLGRAAPPDGLCLGLDQIICTCVKLERSFVKPTTR